MTRRTTGLHTARHRTSVLAAAAAGGFLCTALATGGGCAQQAAQGAASQAAVQAAQVATTAVTTTVTGQNPTPRPRANPAIKFNGRGGYDISGAQQAALKRAHWMRDHHNQVFRPSYPKPPTSQPTTRPS